MWLQFNQLSSAQAIVAQEQLDKNCAPSFLKKTKLREFWVVDGIVKGSRLIRNKNLDQFLDAQFGFNIKLSKTSLHGWTGGPRRWSLNP